MKKLVLVFVIFQNSILLFGQEVVDYPVSLDHIGLSVNDVNNSAEFYKKLFGLEEIIDNNRMEGVIWLSLGEGKELHLQTIDGDNITQYITTHFALTVNDFDSFHKQLTSMEVKYFDYFGNESKISVRPNGVKKTYIKDPDENWVEVISIIND